MSWQASEYVLQNSTSVKTDRTVLLAIASHADSETFTAWPSVAIIAKECGGILPRQVQRSIANLKASGELLVVEHGAPQLNVRWQRRTNLYEILRHSCRDTGDVTQCKVCRDTSTHLVATQATPCRDTSDTLTISKPSLEPPTEPVSEFESIMSDVVKAIATRLHKSDRSRPVQSIREEILMTEYVEVYKWIRIHMFNPSLALSLRCHHEAGPSLEELAECYVNDCWYTSNGGCVNVGCECATCAPLSDVA